MRGIRGRDVGQACQSETASWPHPGPFHSPPAFARSLPLRREPQAVVDIFAVPPRCPTVIVQSRVRPDLPGMLLLSLSRSPGGSSRHPFALSQSLPSFHFLLSTTFVGRPWWSVFF